jgi:hypothetical protein
MKIFAAVIFLCVLAGATAAQSQELILPAPTENAKPTLESENEFQKKARNDLAMQYFDRCQKIMFTDLSPEAQESYCGCTAENMRDRFSIAELTTMATGQGVAVPPEKITIEAEATCIAYPLRELEYKRCIGRETNKFYVTQEAFENMCYCLSDKTAGLVEEHGDVLVAALVAKRGPPDDLVDAIRADDGYQSEYMHWHSVCRDKYAYQ